MQIKLKDKKTGRFLIFSIGKAALLKHGSLVAMSDRKGGWFVDTDLHENGFEWDHIGEHPPFARLPVTDTLSFAVSSEIGEELHSRDLSDEIDAEFEDL